MSHDETKKPPADADAPDGSPGADAQVSDPTAPWVDPNGGEVSHLDRPPGAATDFPGAAQSVPPEEPPEVAAMLAVVRPWQILLLLAFASVWLPAVLAGYGKRLARADHAAAEARWAAEDAARLAADPPGDCDSWAILLSGADRSDYESDDPRHALDRMESLHVAYAADRGVWIPVDDGESPENLARYWSGMPGTDPPWYTPASGYAVSIYYQYLDSRSFASRVAESYLPGSIYYERYQLYAGIAPHLREALACDTWPAPVGPHRETMQRITWWRYNDWLFYELHRAACRGDWASFQQNCSLVFAIEAHQPYGFQRSVCRALGVILEQHGAAMPTAVLLDLRGRLLALQQETPDVDQEVADWKREFLMNYFDAMLGLRRHDDWYWGGTFEEPIFLQRFAMFYPFRRGRVDAYGERLRAEMKAFLATPGPQRSAFAVDGGIAEGLGGGTSVEAGAIGASAFTKSNTVDKLECIRQSHLRLLIASLDALLLRAETGAWPVSLAALGEPALRVDPFSPTVAPLGYRVDATGALRVWSVGSRGVNGGGLFSGEPGHFDYDDIQRVEPPVADANPQAEVAP